MVYKDFKEIQNALSDARKITKFSLQPKEIFNLTVKNHTEKNWLARTLLNVKAFFGIIMICFQNAEWLINHKMMLTVDNGSRVGRSRGFFWAIMCASGCGADICALVASRRKAATLRARLAASSAALRLPTPRLRTPVGRRGVNPLSLSRSHDTLPRLQLPSSTPIVASSTARPPATPSATNADDAPRDSAPNPLRMVPSASLVDVPTLINIDVQITSALLTLQLQDDSIDIHIHLRILRLIWG